MRWSYYRPQCNVVKWGASFPWSFSPLRAETTIMRKTHSTLLTHIMKSKIISLSESYTKGGYIWISGRDTSLTRLRRAPHLHMIFSRVIFGDLWEAIFSISYHNDMSVVCVELASRLQCGRTSWPDEWPDEWTGRVAGRVGNMCCLSCRWAILTIFGSFRLDLG